MTDLSRIIPLFILVVLMGLAYRFAKQRSMHA